MFSFAFNLGALVDRCADAERTLLIDCRAADAPRAWSGAELERASDAYARGLLARGLEAGDRVAIASANRAEFLLAYYGAMRAGLVAVPVNYKLPADTVRYVLEDCDARFVFVDDERAPLAGTLEHVCFDDEVALERFLDPGDHQTVRPGPEDVAMFLYTSGSTGKPKGVPLTHRGHLWVIEQRIQPGVDYRDERILVAAPLYHMNGLAIAKFAAATGATLVLLPQFTTESYISTVAQFECTWLTSVPTMMALVTQRSDLLDRTNLTSVRSVRMGSAPITAELLARVGASFPEAKVQIGYGTTEAGPVVFGPHPDGRPTPALSLGYPHPQVGVRLSGGPDADQGVLEMTCPALTPGYHKLPEKTASVMSADGYYHTGDVMRRDAEGFYYFVGRDDDMFVCNGENVYPEEVERLLESHQDVTQACVVPVEDPVRGQMPVAFVVPAIDRPLDEGALKQFTIENGPAYQHPRRIFAMETLPLASTNKIDRRILAELAANRLTEGDGR